MAGARGDRERDLRRSVAAPAYLAPTPPPGPGGAGGGAAGPTPDVGQLAPSTITAILRRYGRLSPAPPPRDFVRFEHAAPNELWQMDFMGHRALDQGRGHPLTLLDDHSRFALNLTACGDERHTTVREQLTRVFERYGWPRIILTDNGSPWAPAGEEGLTRLEAWLLRLGVAVWHGRPAHPQTQGKVERLHGTIAADVLGTRQFPDLATAQRAFDAFRTCCNQERPHEALADAVPASRYQPSPRPFPATLPEIPDEPSDAVRIVTVHGSIHWQQRRQFVGRGLVGQPVAVRPTAEDGVWAIYYCQRQVAAIDRRQEEKVYPMSLHTCYPSLRFAQARGMTQCGRNPLQLVGST